MEETVIAGQERFPVVLLNKKKNHISVRKNRGINKEVVFRFENSQGKKEKGSRFLGTKNMENGRSYNNSLYFLEGILRTCREYVLC